MKITWKHYSVLPGFGLTLGYTLTYLSLIVLLPLAALFSRCFTAGPAEFWQTISDPRVLAACRLTLFTSLAAAVVNAIFGFIVAWTLVRYRFYGKRLIDGLIDLPFALPTAVSGIALTALYAKNGWVGQWLAPLGVTVAFTPLGIAVALTFIGLPFVIRTVQPALEELDGEVEQAAAVLGANRWQTFWRVLFPSVLPALMTGFALSFARALGEYGSVVFIAGNMPMYTEIASLLMITKLEQYDVTGASVIAVAMLLLSFLILLSINGLQWWVTRRHGKVG